MKPRSENRFKPVVSLICLFAFASSVVASIDSSARVLTEDGHMSVSIPRQHPSIGYQLDAIDGINADDFSSVLLELGVEFEQAGDRDSASLVYQIGLYFYPEHEKLSSALEALNSA